jgi:fructose-1,6-bisphosphatase I
MLYFVIYKMYNNIYMNFGFFIPGSTLHNELLRIIMAIKQSSIEIGSLVSRVSLDNNIGSVDECIQNSSGDEQKKLDVLSNEIMIANLTSSNSCTILLSEENEEAIIVDEEHSGNYIVAFDPLDGSSNIDCNCGVGTIFSIILDKDKTDTVDNRILRNGNDIVCAGYILYGGSTEFVIAFKGNGVHQFTFDKKNNEYTHTGILDITNKDKKIYSINEANYERWDIDMKHYIKQYRTQNSKYTQRWIGSMVSDIHRTLLYGGMFCYPSDENNILGKLRILYECFPMSMIIEEAGGKAIIAKMSNDRILDIIPTNIHQRTPILLGSSIEVNKYSDILNDIKENEVYEIMEKIIMLNGG